MLSPRAKLSSWEAEATSAEATWQLSFSLNGHYLQFILYIVIVSFPYCNRLHISQPPQTIKDFLPGVLVRFYHLPGSLSSHPDCVLSQEPEKAESLLCALPGDSSPSCVPFTHASHPPKVLHTHVCVFCGLRTPGSIHHILNPGQSWINLLLSLASPSQKLSDKVLCGQCRLAGLWES